MLPRLIWFHCLRGQNSASSQVSLSGHLCFYWNVCVGLVLVQWKWGWSACPWVPGDIRPEDVLQDPGLRGGVGSCKGVPLEDTRGLSPPTKLGHCWLVCGMGTSPKIRAWRRPSTPDFSLSILCLWRWVTKCSPHSRRAVRAGLSPTHGGGGSIYRYNIGNQLWLCWFSPWYTNLLKINLFFLVVKNSFYSEQRKITN